MDKIPSKSLFITATDTNIGKTFLTCKLGSFFQKKGLKVAGFKPIASGDRQDAILIKEKLKISEELDLINPVFFDLPLAPYACVIEQKLQINKKDILKKITKAYKHFKKNYDIVLVEGVGGIMVPILHNFFVFDLIKELSLPVLLLARANLGTINHTLLSINKLEQEKIDIAGIILNYYTGQDLSDKTNIQIIEQLSKIKVLAKLNKNK